MTFAQRLTAAARQTERRLADLLGEQELTGPAPAAQAERLLDAMRHAVLSGGKRLRPYLVIESAALFGVAAEAAANAAAAVELIHCYSLVHDDLPAMDNDAMRRGRPTVWRAFDEWTAILAGDALLTLAFDVLARPSTHPDANVRLDLIQAYAHAAGVAGMVGGQALDLMADKLGDPPRPDEAHVQALQSMKTGALLTVSAEAGAILGRASNSERSALRRFGKALGAAFQIADDLLDVEGDATVVGKAVAKDAVANKATLVSLLGVEGARARLSVIESEALEALACFGPSADGLREACTFVVTRRN